LKILLIKEITFEELDIEAELTAVKQLRKAEGDNLSALEQSVSEESKILSDIEAERAKCQAEIKDMADNYQSYTKAISGF
jgi:chromosome segregation ATPase